MTDQISSTKQIITKIVEDVFDEKLKTVDQKFNRLESRIVRLEGRIDGVESRIDKLDSKFDKMLSLMTDMMGEIKDMREEQQLISHKVYDDHENRLQRVENKLNLNVV